MNRMILAALPAAFTTLLALPADAGALDNLPTKGQLPSGTVQISPFIPKMGEHWASPKTLPFGPIYCVIDGHIVCTEYMIAQKDLAAGKAFNDLKPWFVGAVQPAIDHIEFDFNPKGHPGYDVPHYDVHMYFVSSQFLAAAHQQAKE